jgi:Carboxypeptidase regulatory-like domain
MKVRLALMLGAFAFFAEMAFAQQPIPPPSQEPRTAQAEKPGMVRGRVTAADTGAGLRRARVMLRATDSRPGPGTLPLSAQTNENGEYEIKEVKPGRYSVMATRNGYVSQAYGQKPVDFSSMSQPGTLLTVRAGETVSQIDFQLIRGGVVEGHIIDQNNEPLSRVMVQLSRYRTLQGKRNLMPVNMPAMTDDRGYFRLFDVAPGSYYLSATYRSFGFPDGGSAFPPTYYPGVLSPEEASKIQITAGGEVTGINMALTELMSFTISGKVYGSDGKPLSGARVMSVRQSSAESFNVMPAGGGGTDGDGNFKMANIIPGKYRLTARSGREGKMESGSAVVEVGDADINNVALILGSGAEVTGRIVMEDQTGSVDARQIRIFLMPESGAGPFFGGSRPEIKDDLTFRVDNISEGPARFNVTVPPGNFYLKAIRLEGRDLSDQVIEFKNNDRYSGVEVLISSKGAELSGVVKKDENGEVLKGATVILFPSSPERQGKLRFTKTSQTDQQGAFALKGIVPGEYVVCALINHEAGAESDVSYLRELEKSAKAVQLSSGGSKMENLVAMVAPATE